MTLVLIPPSIHINLKILMPSSNPTLTTNDHMSIKPPFFLFGHGLDIGE